MENRAVTLAPIFSAVGQALEQNRLSINQDDTVNHNHGDHMVEIFRVATQAAVEIPESDLADVMDHTAGRLEGLQTNASAQVYARGLHQIAGQMRLRQISLDDLVRTVQGALREEKSEPVSRQPAGEQSHKGSVLKALLSGLAGWSRIEEDKEDTDTPLDFSSMFEFGMAYMQAQQHYDSRIDILADAAVSASPLGKNPYRHRSGMIVVRAMLKAMQDSSSLMGNPGS